MDITDPRQQLDFILQMLGTLPGQLAAAVLVLLTIAASLWRTVWWSLLALLPFMLSIGRSLPQPWLDLRLVPPFDLLHAYSRPIVLALMLALAVSGVITGVPPRRRLLVAATAAFFGMQLMIALRVVLDGELIRAAVMAILFTTGFAAIAVGVRRRLSSPSDVDALMTAMLFSGVLYFAAAMVQYALYAPGAMQGRRFVGISANANFAGLAMAFAVLPGLYLAMQKRLSKFRRLFAACAVAAMAATMAWTGSRNTVLITGVGCFFLFRRRLAGGVLVTIVCGTGAVLLLQTVLQPGEITQRLFSLEDTRTGVWRQMLWSFLSNPLLGGGGGEIGSRYAAGSENSFLLAGAYYGGVVLAPLLLAVFLMLRRLASLNGRRWLLDADTRLSLDVLTGGILGILAGSLFDGYLLGNFAVPVTMLMCYLALMGYQTDLSEAIEQGEVEFAEVGAGDGEWFVGQYRAPHG